MRPLPLVLILVLVLLWPRPLADPPAHMVASSRQAKPERVITCEATAYCYTGHRTFTGTWPQRGTVAVDPRVIPLGTRLYVEGYGYGRAEDTGGAIRGARVDVYLESEAAAREWGRRQVKVRMISDGKVGT